MATVETDNDAKKAGGYLKEKLTIGLSRLSDDECVRAIAKVTSHKLKVPNEKHMARLVQATYGNYNSGKNSYDDINGWIVEQLTPHTHTRNWVVVLKTLLAFHTLLSEGSDDIVNRIASHRQAFNTQHMKDLADSPDGAMQMGLIHGYARYLEEKCVALTVFRQNFKIGSARIESPEFEEQFLSMAPAAAASVADAMLLQMDAMLGIDFRPLALNNFASLEAFKRSLSDGRRLFVLLSKRVLRMLDNFMTFSQPMKKAWIAIYKHFCRASSELGTIFDAVNKNGTVNFGEVYPTIVPMPASVLQQLEDMLMADEIPVVKLSSVLPSGVASTETSGSQRSTSPDLLKRQPPAPEISVAPQPTQSAPVGIFFAPEQFVSGGSSSQNWQQAQQRTPSVDAFDALFEAQPTQKTASAVAQPVWGTNQPPPPIFDPFAASNANAKIQQPQQLDFDPFADVSTASKPQPAVVDFFGQGPVVKPSAVTNQGSSSRGSTAAEQQLDFFAQAQQQPSKRAW